MMFRSIQVAWFLAGKSIIRVNWGLNIMTVLMMVLVYVNLLFVPSLLDGVVDKTNGKLISSQTSNITVSSKKEGGVEDAESLMDQIRRIKGVEGVTATRVLPAEISRAVERTTVEVTAVNPNNYGDVFITPYNMVEGEFLSPEDTDKIILGAQIAGGDNRLELYADSLKDVHAGDKVLVTYSGNIKKEYTVKGIFKNEFVESDLKTIINDREFDNIKPASNPDNISIKLAQDVSEHSVIEQIKQLREGLEFRTWHDRAGFVRSFTDSLETVNRILRAVALFVVGITIFIVTYVDLVNKRRQIGIERAIGIDGNTIILVYLFRALVYTVIGTILGAVIFLTVVIPIEAAFPFSFPFGDVFLVTTPRFMVLNGLILIIVGMISALLPAWRSMRISIIDAIWGS